MHKYNIDCYCKFAAFLPSRSTFVQLRVRESGVLHPFSTSVSVPKRFFDTLRPRFEPRPDTFVYIFTIFTVFCGITFLP